MGEPVDRHEGDSVYSTIFNAGVNKQDVEFLKELKELLQKHNREIYGLGWHDDLLTEQVVVIDNLIVSSDYISATSLEFMIDHVEKNLLKEGD